MQITPEMKQKSQKIGNNDRSKSPSYNMPYFLAGFYFERKNRSAPVTILEERLCSGKEESMTANHVWDRAWKMVVDRTATAETMFVYAVRTTGIYCRPSCPSRRPLRRSVEFYPTSDLAERAGYRACKRCTPAQEHPQLRTLTAACNYLDQHVQETVKLQELGKAVGLSPFHVQRIFRRCLGITPREYQQARRIERFRQSGCPGRHGNNSALRGRIWLQQPLL